MTDDAFKALCNTFGFAPSRALREMLDKAMEQEREACAALADAERSNTNVLLSYPTQSSAAYNIGIAIRARSNT